MDDAGPSFGSSIANMLAPPFARQRPGSSLYVAEEDDVPLGLHEFLQLCQTVGAEPWYVLPPAISPAEMQSLMDYLGGAASTPYGAIRASLGQSAPWTSVFPVIHLELGNEQWNHGTFPGEVIDNPVAYGNRVTTIFGAARSTPSYQAGSFDLIMGSQVVNSWLTGQEAANASNYDSIAVAPYLFGTFNDASSTEAIYGPMFAEPEMWDDSPAGYMYLQAQAAKTAGKNLVVYEENLSTQSGTAAQSIVNSVVPSVGGGVMMADHMLLQMRDLGIKTQNVWALPGYSNQFANPNGSAEISPVYGTVVDMGGQSNLRRPVFLAEQMTNAAILPQMLGTTVSGANPTWSQPLSTNDSVQLNTAHELQSFAFTDGAHSRSLVVVNLSRTTARPVTFSGANAPSGTVTVSQLTSANLTDTNEAASTVATTSNTVNNFQPASAYSLPPFSVTVFAWQQ
jgi:alpha-L-arabinofuranosidase